MRLVAALADADIDAVVSQVGRAHAHEITRSLACCAAQESHSAQVRRGLIDDKRISFLGPGLRAAFFNHEAPQANRRIVVAVAARDAPFDKHAQHREHKIGGDRRAAHAVAQEIDVAPGHFPNDAIAGLGLEPIEAELVGSSRGSAQPSPLVGGLEIRDQCRERAGPDLLGADLGVAQEPPKLRVLRVSPERHPLAGSLGASPRCEVVIGPARRLDDLLHTVRKRHVWPSAYVSFVDN